MGREVRWRRRDERDGVRVESTRGPWIMIFALAAVVLVAILVRVRLRSEEAGDDTEKPLRKDSGRSAAGRSEHGSERRMELIPVRRDAPRPAAPGTPTPRGEEATPAGTPVVPPTPEAKAPHEPGWEASQEQAAPVAEIPPPPPPSDYGWEGPAGIGLFPPPGTKPPQPGIIVPDDYQLPPGYIRYYQTTDDGRSLRPVLAFSPDYDFVDANGNPVEIPESRIVPPEMAPPGLPVEMLEIPEVDYGPPREEVERFLAEHPEYQDLSPEEFEKARAAKGE